MSLYAVFDFEFWYLMLRELWWVLAIPCALSALVGFLIARRIYGAK